MSVLLIVGPKWTLAASHTDPGESRWVLPTGQTDKRTDARPLHCAFRGQR